MTIPTSTPIQELPTTAEEQAALQDARAFPQEYLGMQNKEFTTLYSKYVELFNSSDGLVSSIRSGLSSYISTLYGVTKEQATVIAKEFITLFNSPSFRTHYVETNIEASKLLFSIPLEDLRTYASLTSSEEDPRVKSLLLAFLVSYYRNYHSSKWIRYDRKTIFYLAGLSKLRSIDQESLTKILHDKYQIGMRVIGSNQPIPCFNIPWCSNAIPSSSNLSFDEFMSSYMSVTTAITPEILQSISKYTNQQLSKGE